MAIERSKPAFTTNGWLAAALFFLVLGAFLPCLRNGFVRIDDYLYVTDNSHVQRGLTWEGWKWAWKSTEAQNWHPLTWMSHMLDVDLFGLKPAGHHAVSVFLHALNTVLLFRVFQEMTRSRWRSLAVAALFGLHPLRVESVAWISERKDVLSVLFWILALGAYARYAQAAARPLKPAPAKKPVSPPNPNIRPAPGSGSRARGFYILALLLFGLGLLCKPMLVTLPFVLLLLDFWPLGRLGIKARDSASDPWPGPRCSPVPLVQLGAEKIPFLLMAAASSVVTYLVQEHGGAVTTSETLSLPARLDNALVSYARYLGKSFWPLNLSIMYPHPGHWPAQTVAAAGLSLAVLTVMILLRWRTLPYLTVGWLWFLGTLVPTIGVVQVGRQAMADRYTYIPSIGLLLGVVWWLSKLSASHPKRKLLAQASLATSLAACGILTVRQVSFWKDNPTLFRHAMEVTERNWIMTASLGDEWQMAGEMDQAIEMYQQTLRVNPYYTEVRLKLANVLLKRRRFTDALAQFEQVVAEKPEDVEARQGLGATLQDTGRLDAAIDQYNQIIRLRPDFADAYSNLGNCYGLKGRVDDAIRCLEQAVKLKPNLAQNHRELGVGLANKGRWDEAISQFQAALQLDASDRQAQADLAAAAQERAKATQNPIPH